MKKYLALTLLGIFSILVFAFNNTKVLASEILNNQSITIYVDETEMEIVSNIEVVEDNTLNIPSLANSMHSTDVWMSVKTDLHGRPALKGYWYVKYVNGKKYQGYVYWTGDKRVKNWGPPPQLEFKFSGILRLA